MAQLRAGQGLLYHPATSLWLRDQCLGWQWGWHCSPGAARSPSPAEAGGWSCSALVLPPLLLAALHRDPQADPEVQEPPWMFHILPALSLLEGPQHGTGPSHWPQTTLGPREGAARNVTQPCLGQPHHPVALALQLPISGAPRASRRGRAWGSYESMAELREGPWPSPPAAPAPSAEHSPTATCSPHRSLHVACSSSTALCPWHVMTLCPPCSLCPGPVLGTMPRTRTW